MSWTFPYLGETEELNESTRAEAPGDFVRLSNGYTHYELGGQKNGQPVVFVHGFSVPYFIWEPTFNFLAESGFRVLRYDLFGRGFSDRPKVLYDIDLFSNQLKELLDVLGFEQINLMGLSMGGPIASTYATRYPDRVNKLVLVDPAGAKPVTLSRLLKAVTTPGFGELALGLFGRKHMLEGIASDFYDPENVRAFADRYMVQLKYKGFMRAILSTMRSGMLDSFADVYQQLGAQGTPVALFWGKNDKTVPFEHNVDIRIAVPQAKFYAIDKCGHIPHYEKPNEFNPILLEFLNQR